MKKGISFLFYRIGLLIALFSFCTLSFAGGPEAPPPPSFNGAYLDAGWQAVLIQPVQGYLQAADRNLGGGLTDDIVKLPKQPWKVNGAGVNLGIGWGHVFGSDPTAGFYWGINANFMSGGSWRGQPNVAMSTLLVAIAVPNQVVTFPLQVTENYVFSALMKFGYAWSRYLIYLGLGFSAANVTFDAPVPNNAVSSNAADYQWDPGYTGGVGFEAMLAPRWILGVNYMYTRYNTMMHVLVGSTQPNFNAFWFGWVHAHFQTQRLGVYMEYKFAT